MKEEREPVLYRWSVVLPDSTVLKIDAEIWGLLENRVLEFYNYGKNFSRYSVAVFAHWHYIENLGPVPPVSPHA
jgi:hypothetical protein